MNPSTAMDLSRPLQSAAALASPNTAAPERAEHGPGAPGASVLRGAMALFSTQPITWAASLALIVLLPRYLGAEALGEYTVVLTIASLAGTLASFGIPDFLVRHVAMEPLRAHANAGAAFVLGVGASIVLALVLLGGLSIIHPVVSDGSLLLVGLAGMVVQAAQNPILSLIRGLERHGPFAWLNALATVLVAVLGIAVLVMGGSAAIYMASGVVVSAVITGIAMRSVKFRLERSAFQTTQWREVAGGGLTFFGMNVTLRIRGEIDKLLLATLASTSAVGWYAAALRVVSIPIFIPTLVVTPLLPALTRCAGDQPVFLRTLRRSIEVVLVLMLPLGAMLLALAPSLPELLTWGANFDSSVPLLMVLACQMPLIGMDMVLSTALVALHRERQWLRVMVIGAVFNPVLNVILIKVFEATANNGGIGAAITTVATEGVMFVGALLALPRGTIDARTTIVAGKLLVAAMLLVAVVRLAMPISPFLGMAAGGVEWLIALAVLGLVQPSDVQLVRRTALAAIKGRFRTRAAAQS